MTNENKMNIDYFADCVSQVVCSYAQMHAAKMEWALELDEILVTKCKTFTFNFFTFLRNGGLS